MCVAIPDFGDRDYNARTEELRRRPIRSSEGLFDGHLALAVVRRGLFFGVADTDLVDGEPSNVLRETASNG